ncbi:MAG: metallophosphoesterase family protein [Treponema sp.]|nr:metallophosphoesterase family protein [Treponema sp.]
MKIRNFLLAAVGLLMLASCQTQNTETLMDILQGKPKKESQWGKLDDNFPNNVGNTFNNDPKTTRIISWQSKSETGEVIMGNDTKVSASIKNGDWYFHHVNLDNLVPGKTYSYIVGSGGKYSPIYTFKTENDNLPNGFSIIHVTDPQIGTSNNPDTGKSDEVTDAGAWKRVIEAALTTCPDAAFIVNTGDVVNTGSSATVPREDRIPYYFDYAQKSIANNAFIYALGNNDTLDWFGKYFYANDNQNVDTSGVLYSFNYGSAHFISINEVFSSSNDDDDSEKGLSYGSGSQMAWLEDDLKAASEDQSIKSIVVMTHQPDFGKKTPENADTDLAKLFEKYNVNLVLAGHYHFYMRSKSILATGDEVTDGTGTVWFIPNASGSKLNDVPAAVRDYWERAEQPGLPMFTQLDFTQTGIRLRAYTVDSGNADLFEDVQL